MSELVGSNKAGGLSKFGFVGLEVLVGGLHPAQSRDIAAMLAGCFGELALENMPVLQAPVLSVLSVTKSAGYEVPFLLTSRPHQVIP